MGTGHQGSRHHDPRMRLREGLDQRTAAQIRQGISRAAALTFAAALALLGPSAFAQTSTEIWPSRFVRLIVPFPAGGGADAIARILSARLAATWGQQVVDVVESQVPAALRPLLAELLRQGVGKVILIMAGR